MDSYDDIISFRHIRYPHLIIQNPKFYIRIYHKASNLLCGVYGCYILPTKQDLLQNILPCRIFEEQGDVFSSTLDINLNDYYITINGHPIN